MKKLLENFWTGVASSAFVSLLFLVPGYVWASTPAFICLVSLIFGLFVVVTLYLHGKRKTIFPWKKHSLEEIREKAKILIIDDDGYPHYDALEDRGFNITRIEAIDSKEAETYELKYDLILLDIMGVKDDLEAEDGVDALRLIRRHNSWIPIVLYSAHSGPFKSKERKKFALENTNGLFLKKETYGDFSTKVANSIGEAWERDYFVKLLRKYGISQADEVLKRLEQDPESFDVSPLIPGGTPATDISKIKRTIQIASGFLLGKRCQSS